MSSEKPRPNTCNRDRRLSSLLSGIDTLTDIDTRAADQYRPVPHEHSITSFHESQSSIGTDEHRHECRSPLEHESTEEKRVVFETAEPSFRASSQQQQNKTQIHPTPQSPVLVSAPGAPHLRRRETVANGTVLRRERDIDSPPPSPTIPVFFGDAPVLKSPPLLRATDSVESADALEGVAVEAKSLE